MRLLDRLAVGPGREAEDGIGLLDAHAAARGPGVPAARAAVRSPAESGSKHDPSRHARGRSNPRPFPGGSLMMAKTAKFVPCSAEKSSLFGRKISLLEFLGNLGRKRLIGRKVQP